MHPDEGAVQYTENGQATSGAVWAMLVPEQVQELIQALAMALDTSALVDELNEWRRVGVCIRLAAHTPGSKVIQPAAWGNWLAIVEKTDQLLGGGA